MSTPHYIAPLQLADALEIKRQHGAAARFIAGGTDLILRMRDSVLTPELLIDVRHLSLDNLTMASTGLLLGAAVTHEQILRNKEVNSLFPALVEACRPFAGPPIRNRGTIGGNIVNASPAADLVPALIAYDASIKLVSAAGERQLELQDFFTGPGQTTMAQDEILTEICLPAMPNRSAARFIKLGHRKSMAISIVNTAVRVGLNSEGTISQCRIVLGAVAPTPVRAILAEDLLCGEELDADTIANAAGQACREVSPISDVRSTGDYRRQMTTVVVRRALTAVMEDLLDE